jgi:hypothetical protein
MRYIRPKFPVRAMLNIVHRGSEIQKCSSSRPGMPFRMKEEGVVLVPFKNDIMIVGRSW